MIPKVKIEQLAHAKLRPPSSARRWISCPGSVNVVPLYPNEDSVASLKGTRGHSLLENGILFGLKPEDEDPDLQHNIEAVLEHVQQTRAAYGKDCAAYAERRYSIPETGEFGTCDVTYVSPKVLHIADYKDGYVLVNVKMNAQMMTYLLGAIAEFGERPKYVIEVYQPNGSHIDGPYRQYEVTPEDVEWFRTEVKNAVNATDYRAGSHCKDTYCPHRAACSTFNKWQLEQERCGWFTSEINAISDDELRERLDYLDTLQGQRDEARKEAMRRIMNMDRTIPGFKLVKGSKDRDYNGDDAVQAIKAICIDLGATDEDLFDKRFTTVAGIERFVKKRFKDMGRGAWKQAWDNSFLPHIKEYSSSLSLTRATDARPSHKRGSEFGILTSTDSTEKLTQII